jgi:hypothetical protein
MQTATHQKIDAATLFIQVARLCPPHPPYLTQYVIRDMHPFLIFLWQPNASTLQRLAFRSLALGRLRLGDLFSFHQSPIANLVLNPRAIKRSQGYSSLLKTPGGLSKFAFFTHEIGSRKNYK